MLTSTTMASTYGAPAMPYEGERAPSNPASFRSQSKLREILRDQSRREEKHHQQQHHGQQHYFGSTGSSASSTPGLNDVSGGAAAAARLAHNERQRRPSLVPSISAIVVGADNAPPRRRRETLLTSKTSVPLEAAAMVTQQTASPLVRSASQTVSPLPRQYSLRRTHDLTAEVDASSTAAASHSVTSSAVVANSSPPPLDANTSRQARSHSAATNLNGGIDLKVVILGSQGVGKTSLVHRYTSGQFSASAVPSTIGASFLTKKLIVDNVKVRLQLWDTAGQERFRSMAPMYYRGANAAVIVYDITNPHTFEDVKTWIDELRQNVQSDLVIHIVGSKVDLAPQQRRVHLDDAQQTIADWTAQRIHDEKRDLPRASTVGATHSIFGSRKGIASSPSLFVSAIGQPSSPPTPPMAAAVSGAAANTPRVPGLGSLAALGPRTSHDRADAVEGDRASNPSSSSSNGAHQQLDSPHDWNFIDVSEVSAKDNEGIEDVFVGIATRLVERKEELEARALAKRRQDRQSVYLGDGEVPEHYLAANPQAPAGWCCST